MVPPYGGLWLQSLAQNDPKQYLQLEREGKLKPLAREKGEAAKNLHERLVKKELANLSPAEKKLPPQDLRAALDMKVKEVVLHELGILVPPVTPEVATTA